MKTKKLLLAAVLLLPLTSVVGQGVGINASGAQPDASAGLDVNFTDKGMLIPRMTQAQRDAIVNPAVGLQLFNTDSECFNFWTGTTWRQSCYDCDFATPTVGNNGPLCEGATLNLTATTIPGATYSWAGPNAFTSNQQNPSISNVTSSASGVYSLQVTLNGCTGNPITTVATVNATPQTPTAGNDGPACLNGSANLTASSIVGASYAWTGPNGYTANTQNPVLTNLALTHAGTYNVVATVNGCPSSAGTTNLAVGEIPVTPGSITGSSSEVPNSTGVAYSVGTVSGATSYTWTVPSGAIVASGQGTNSITVNFATTSGNICVTADNYCGSSSTSCKAVTVSYPQSCLAKKTSTPGATNGIYVIDPDLTGPISPFSVYCDMTTDGGGFTLALVQNVGIDWNCLNGSYTPPTNPTSSSSDVLHPDAFDAMGATEMYVWETGNNRILKFYYARSGVDFTDNYGRLTMGTCYDGSHYVGDAPHTGQGRNGCGHTNEACATGSYIGWKNRTSCFTDASNSHPSWGNCPGQGSSYSGGAPCWAYGGSGMSDIQTFNNCSSGDQANWASYTTGSMSGQINVWVR